MHVHHLNCGCMCPWGGRLWDGASSGLSGRLVCHCLLIETNQGLVLIDTGFGTRDVAAPYERVSPLFIQMNRIRFDWRFTALAEVEARGFSARDVRHIVLTHLDFDHAGGLEDFPDATVHVMQDEVDAARSRDGFIARRRYAPDQWDDVRHWHFHSGDGERWFGFEAVRDLPGLPPEILMIPLAGHTEGQAGVAIETPQGWLLNAGDAYFHRHEMDRHPHCTPGLAAYQRMMEVDREERLANQDRLRELSHQRRGVRIFCSHDPIEYEALVQLSVPTGAPSMAAPSVRSREAGVATSLS
jgi:glyoxylase-like metal-dependent hydrolase (beta-lactamase superfamily II)